MYTQEEVRSARLAREKQVYRYTTALETGDIDTIASLWYKAEYDATLESMLLETHTVYMNEGARAVATDKELAAQVLENMLLTPVAVQEETGNGNELHGLHRHRSLMPRRISRVGALAQSLVAVLVVGLIVSGFLVLFAARHAGTVSTGTKTINTKTINWRVVGSPNGPQSYSELYGVAVISANDVWAVGANADVSLESYGSFLPRGIQTLIEHWNGSQWQIVPSPNIGTQGNFLDGVAAISSNNVWAIGMYANSSHPTLDKTLIEHWDGTQWSIVPSPNPGPKGNRLNAITVVSPDDIWSAGSADDQNANQQTLIEHWNGSQWQEVSSPKIPPKYDALGGVIGGVTAISSNNIWAVGEAYTGNTRFLALVEHWDGSKWSIVPSPNPGNYGSALSGVTAISANNIWAVGQTDTSQTSGIQTLVEHWNGMQWSVVPSPNIAKVGNLFFAVTAISANNIWAAGVAATRLNGPDSQPLVEHWNGTKWSIVPSPHSGISRLIQYITWVPGTNHLWVVGSTLLNKNEEQTLTEIGTFG